MLIDLILSLETALLLMLALAVFHYTRGFPRVRMRPDHDGEIFAVRTRASWLPFRKRIVQVKLFNKDYVTVNEETLYERYGKYLLVEDCPFKTYMSLHWEIYGAIASSIFPAVFTFLRVS